MAIGPKPSGRQPWMVGWRPSFFAACRAVLIRVVTARDMDDGERGLFRRKQVNRMKKKLPPAKTPLPRFRSDQEAAKPSRDKRVSNSKDVVSIVRRLQSEMEPAAPPLRTAYERPRLAPSRQFGRCCRYKNEESKRSHGSSRRRDPDAGSSKLRHPEFMVARSTGTSLAVC